MFAEIKDDMIMGQGAPLSNLITGHCNLSHGYLDRFYSNFFETSSDAVFLADQQGEIVWLNPVARQYMTRENHELLEKRLDTRCLSGVEKGLFPLVKSMINDILLHKKEYRSFEESCIINGNMYTFLWDTHLIMEKNHLAGMLLIAKDITQCRLAHEEMTRCNMQKIIDQVASGLAHEIRNPLTAVRGFIQLLHMSLKRSSKREYLQVALDELDRANSFIKDFLLYVRPAAPSFSLVPLEQVIESAFAEVRAEAAQKGIHFEMLSSGSLPLMYIDQEQICRAFTNVLQNAVDFTDKGSVIIHLMNHEKADKVIFTVKDTGCGISQQNMSRIFDPFFTTKEEAPGMGLTLTQSIIKNHGGEISVTNNSLGGTVFSIELYHVSKYPEAI